MGVDRPWLAHILVVEDFGNPSPLEILAGLIPDNYLAEISI